MMTDRQLDIWAELLFEKADSSDKIAEETDMNKNPYKCGLAIGTSQGLRQALTLLSVVEKGERMRSKIQEIEEKLDAQDRLK
jgi:hypothetical protein